MPPLTVAWISDFPVEWLPDFPEPARQLPRQHALTWQRVLLDEFKENPALKLHVLVLRKQLERNLTFERDGVTFHLLKVPGGLRAPSLFWIDTLVIRRKLQEIRPDLVHAWGTERGAALVARRLGRPYVVTIQGLLSWYQALIPLSRYERFACFLEKLSLPHAPLVTTESTVAVRFLQKRFPELRVWQAEHAANWIFHRLERRPQTALLRFLFVGYLDYRKGGDLLLAALDRIKDEFAFEFVIIGKIDPGLRAKFDGSAIRERVQFRENLPPAEVATELSLATMLLFPTRADTSPNAVKEAVAAGVPVVASAMGGIIDYVLPGENGFTFPSENIEAFVEALRAACRHPLFSRGQVEPAALEKTRAYLSPAEMARRFFQAYQIALGREEMGEALMHPPVVTKG